VNLAQQYLRYYLDALIRRLAEIVVHDNFTEMHAFQAPSGDLRKFHATRLPRR
jgi:hypothetical protein